MPTAVQMKMLSIGRELLSTWRRAISLAVQREKKFAHSSFVESVRWSVRGHVPSRATAAASAAACGLRHPHGRLACHSLLGR